MTTRHVRQLAALGGVALAAAAPASPRTASAQHHGGVPARVVADRGVGPYLVSVWAAPAAGSAMIYVVYAARDGASLVPPTSVRVGVAPASGRLTEALYVAHPERVRHGARYVAHVALGGPNALVLGDAWRVRVVTEGAAGGGELRTQFDAAPDGAPGPAGLALYATPFVLVAALRWRVAAARAAS